MFMCLSGKSQAATVQPIFSNSKVALPLKIRTAKEPSLLKQTVDYKTVENPAKIITENTKFDKQLCYEPQIE